MTAQQAAAQNSMAERLSSERLADIEPGTYQAGDSITFSLNNEDGNYLLQINGVPEVFVLYTGNASLGGRILKYDSGETAMRVSGWGGITLYTDANPGGLPAVRVGDSVPPNPPNISLPDLQKAARNAAEALAASLNVQIAFDTNWKALAHDAAQRALTYDTMENTTRGIVRYATNKKRRNLLSNNVNGVSIETSAKPTLGLRGKTLIVTFNPGRDYTGRASSRAIARALSTVLSRRSQK